MRNGLSVEPRFYLDAEGRLSRDASSKDKQPAHVASSLRVSEMDSPISFCSSHGVC